MIVTEALVHVNHDAREPDGQIVHLPHCSEIFGVRTPEGYTHRLDVFVSAYEEGEGLDPDRPQRLYRLWVRRPGDRVPTIRGGCDWSGLVWLAKGPAVVYLRRWHA